MSNLNEIIERVDALRNNYTPDGFPVLSHLCHELAAIRDALQALPPAPESYIVHCLIKPREGEQIVQNIRGRQYLVMLDQYAIIPLEEYYALSPSAVAAEVPEQVTAGIGVPARCYNCEVLLGDHRYHRYGHVFCAKCSVGLNSPPPETSAKDMPRCVVCGHVEDEHDGYGGMCEDDADLDDRSQCGCLKFAAPSRNPTEEAKTAPQPSCPVCGSATCGRWIAYRDHEATDAQSVRVDAPVATVTPNITGERAELWLFGEYRVSASADVDDVLRARDHINELAERWLAMRFDAQSADATEFDTEFVPKSGDCAMTALWEVVRHIAKTLYRRAEGEIDDVEVSWYMQKINADAIAMRQRWDGAKCTECGKGRGGVCGACHCGTVAAAEGLEELREKWRAYREHDGTSASVEAAIDEVVPDVPTFPVSLGCDNCGRKWWHRYTVGHRVEQSWQGVYREDGELVSCKTCCTSRDVTRLYLENKVPLDALSRPDDITALIEVARDLAAIVATIAEEVDTLCDEATALSNRADAMLRERKGE